MYRRIIALSLVVAALCGSSDLLAQSPGELRGRVIAVADGDTITVLDVAKQQHRVRLNGIDAPEGGQAFGTVAKTSLSGLVFGKDVTVVGNKLDRYGRLIGTVIVGSTNANFEQLRAGLAWYYREYAGDVAPENRPQYEAAETEARTAGIGLWRDPRPVAPWSYRRPEPARAFAPSAPFPERGPVPGSRVPVVTALSAPPALGRIIGNKNSRIYHVPGCRNYNDVAPQNQVPFNTEAEALAAGYRKARNCD